MIQFTYISIIALFFLFFISIFFDSNKMHRLLLSVGIFLALLILFLLTDFFVGGYSGIIFALPILIFMSVTQLLMTLILIGKKKEDSDAL